MRVFPEWRHGRAQGLQEHKSRAAWACHEVTIESLTYKFILHSMCGVLMTLILECGRYDISMGDPVAALGNHINAMWEANCSCRAEGYPETSFEELSRSWGDGSTCSGLPSPIDVPTRSQAVARESAAEALRYIRHMAGWCGPTIQRRRQQAITAI